MKLRLSVFVLITTLIILSVPSLFAQPDILPLPRQSSYNNLAQYQKLTPSDGRPGYTFGVNLAISSDATMIMVADTPQDDSPPQDGKVYVFTLEGNSWKETQILTAQGDDYYLGRNIVISDDGSTALVGAYDSYLKGVVYFYQRDINNTWQLQQDFLRPGLPYTGDYFARSIGISDDGTIAAIGAMNAVHIFTRTGQEWTEEYIIPKPTQESGCNFGRTLSISGDGSTVVIGTECGVYVYTKGATGYNFMQVLLEARATGFVTKLSADGSTLLVNQFPNNFTDSGSAIVLVRDQNGRYIQQEELKSSDNEPTDNFASNLTLSQDGNTAIVTSPTNNQLGTASGAAYIFTRENGVWTEQQKLVALDAGVGDLFGGAASFAENTVVLATPRDDNDLGLDAGSVYVFNEPINPDLPDNDDVNNPIRIVNQAQYNFSERFQNSTKEGDPIPPNNVNCPVVLPNENTGAIHYVIDAGLGGSKVVRSGAPAWYRRSQGSVTDSAIVIYQVDANDEIVGDPVACADDAFTGAPGVSSAVFTLDPLNKYRVVVWRETNAANGAIIEMDEATFDIVSPVDTTVTSPSVPLTFSWKPYSGATRYFAKFVRSLGNDARLIVELDPTNPSDNVVCTVDLCTLNVPVNSEIGNFLTLGDYLWSVAAAAPEGNELKSLGNSNQINRLRVSDAVTPTSTPQASMLVNGDFEDDTNNWIANGLLGDRVKCNKDVDNDGDIDKEVAYEGNCAFRFSGDTKASLKQTISETVTTQGETATLSAYVRGKELSNSSLRVVFKYSETDKQKGKLEFSADTLTDYQLFTSEPIPMLDGTAKVNVTIRTNSGKLFIDSVTLTKSASLLALPQ
jgi:hypothetical protein